MRYYGWTGWCRGVEEKFLGKSIGEGAKTGLGWAVGAVTNEGIEGDNGGGEDEVASWWNRC